MLKRNIISKTMCLEHAEELGNLSQDVADRATSVGPWNSTVPTMGGVLILRGLKVAHRLGGLSGSASLSRSPYVLHIFASKIGNALMCNRQAALGQLQQEA